jgi:hypothetical protein
MLKQYLFHWMDIVVTKVFERLFCKGVFQNVAEAKGFPFRDTARAGKSDILVYTPSVTNLWTMPIRQSVNILLSSA